MRPTALRADVYAGTERPVGIDRQAVTQRDLLSTVCEQRHAARSSRVLRRLALADVPRRTDRSKASALFSCSSVSARLPSATNCSAARSRRLQPILQLVPGLTTAKESAERAQER